VLIDRVLIASEKTADECFVHNRHGLCRLVVGSGKVTSSDEPDAQVLE
jgi:hypothetical protein